MVHLWNRAAVSVQRTCRESQTTSILQELYLEVEPSHLLPDPVSISTRSALNVNICFQLLHFNSVKIHVYLNKF